MPAVDGSQVTGVIPAILIRAYATFKWTDPRSRFCFRRHRHDRSNGVGDYTVTFAAPMPSVHYAISSVVKAAGGILAALPIPPSGVGAPALMTTTQVRLVVYAYGAGFVIRPTLLFRSWGG